MTIDEIKLFVDSLSLNQKKRLFLNFIWYRKADLNIYRLLFEIDSGVFKIVFQDTWDYYMLEDFGNSLESLSYISKTFSDTIRFELYLEGNDSREKRLWLDLNLENVIKTFSALINATWFLEKYPELNVLMDG